METPVPASLGVYHHPSYGDHDAQASIGFVGELVKLRPKDTAAARIKAEIAIMDTPLLFLTMLLSFADFYSVFLKNIWKP
jgi:hypothetical protein